MHELNFDLHLSVFKHKQLQVVTSPFSFSFTTTRNTNDFNLHNLWNNQVHKCILLMLLLILSTDNSTRDDGAPLIEFQSEWKWNPLTCFFLDQEAEDAPACAAGRAASLLPSVAIPPSIHPASSPESLFIIIELHSWQPIKQDILFLTTCSYPLLHPILRHQSFSVTGAPKSFLTAL